jgi:hypothetical protein
MSDLCRATERETMKKISTTALLLCLSLFALDEQIVYQDTNTTNSVPNDKNSIPQKTINFFSGIVDDFREFAADNNLIDKSKR